MATSRLNAIEQARTPKSNGRKATRLCTSYFVLCISACWQQRQEALGRCCQTLPASGKLRPENEAGPFARSFRVFVTASTECFPDLPLHEALQRLVDLEFTSVEIAIAESGPGLK